MISKINSYLLISSHVSGLYFFTKKKENAEQKKISSEIDSTMLCKFVIDGAGKKIGESVSMNHDVLIIKSGSQFLGVPLKHIESAEKTLVVKGLIDFTKAYELGEKWRKESYHEMTHHDDPEKQSR